MFARQLGFARARVSRALHTSKISLTAAESEAKPGYKAQLEKYKKKAVKNMHVLEMPSITTWQEMPKGGIHRGPDSVWKIWYNPAIVPLFFPIIVAGGLCGWYLYRYFGSNVEIAWSKEVRGSYDHTGSSDRRADNHTKRLLYPGILNLSHRGVWAFPFNFKPIAEIRENHRIPYKEDGED